MEENRDYHAYRYGDYLTPGSELKIEHSVVCENVDISTLITMGTDSLEAMRQGSIDGEQKAYELVVAAAKQWEQQAAATQTINRALEYLRTPEIVHTGNQWKDTDNWRADQKISNRVYQMTCSIWEDTKYDRETKQSIPVAFLISLIYSILFNRLCERADDVYGGRLPIHVRCLIDEAANIGQIPNLERLMATIRSREISACLVLQAQSQLKALYKDNMDTIIGNCDASLFLGGKEETTLKSWNSLLGKETIDLYNTSVTKGNQESHGQNFQKLGKDLMSVDELAVMDGGKCLLQIRGVRPFLSRKYDITKHPNYKLLSDFNEKNAFNIEKFLSTRMPMRPGERYRNYEVTAEDLASQTL